MSSHSPTQNDALALAGGTVYANPSDPPIRNAVVLTNGNKIVAAGTRAQVSIPSAAQVVDCTGRTITAGFWNSHVHFMERKWADAVNIAASELSQQFEDMLTRYGFTSAFDLSSDWQNTRRLRDRIESGEARGPKIYSTGLGLLPANPRLPPDAIVSFMGWMNAKAPEAGSAAEAVQVAKTHLAAGVDGIKVFASVGPAVLPQATIEAVVNEAHRAGKPVFVHPNTGADVVTSLRAGVDVIAHTTPNAGPWDAAVMEEMKAHHAALIPTLWIWKWYARHDRRSAEDKVVETEGEQLRAWIAGGGVVLFGTDLGAVDPDPSGEYALMAHAGMNFRQILASLTTAPAERFGKSHEQGRIAAGFVADLVVLKNDPEKNLLALTDVQYTIRGGKITFPKPRGAGVYGR